MIHRHDSSSSSSSSLCCCWYDSLCASAGSSGAWRIAAFRSDLGRSDDIGDVPLRTSDAVDDLLSNQAQLSSSASCSARSCCSRVALMARDGVEDTGDDGDDHRDEVSVRPAVDDPGPSREPRVTVGDRRLADDGTRAKDDDTRRYTRPEMIKYMRAHPEEVNVDHSGATHASELEERQRQELMDCCPGGAARSPPMGVV